MRYSRTFNGDMSTFLGFACFRSSPKLGGLLLCSSARTASRECLTLGTLLPKTQQLSGRWLSTLSSRDDKTSSKSLTSHITRRPWCQPSSSSFAQQQRTLFAFKSQRVITEYVYLPDTYKDEEGLPFQEQGEEEEGLSREETAEIFPGLNMAPARAYKLLQILHGRRVAGTLDDPSLAENTATFTPSEINNALEYLRKTVPVDEILNAGLRAEDELRQLEVDLAQDENETTHVDRKAPEKDAVDDRRAIYGESILDQIRAANIARREAEERAEEEQRKREEEMAAQNWGGLAQYDSKLHRGLHPQQVQHYEAATSDLNAPPDIPRWRVLLPITTFFIVVLGGLYFAVSQVAPRPGAELLEGISEGRVAVGSVALLNLLVFVAWKRVRLWKFLNQHFILDFVTPRPHQLLTAMFTHLNANYLLKNTLWLVAGGTLFAEEVGAVPFLATYLASGMSGFMWTMVSHVVRGELTYMMGASSATFGVVCAYFWLYRFDGFKVLGLPPDPYQGIQGLGIIGLIMMFYALMPIARGNKGNVAWSGHLVGMLTGMASASVMEKKWKVAKGERMLAEDEAEEKKLPAGAEKEDQKKA